MEYIIILEAADRAFIARKEDDGTYRKIGQAFNPDAGAMLVHYANIGVRAS